MVIFGAIIIIYFLILLFFLPETREQVLKDIVVIQRNSTFKNDFKLWTDLPKPIIEELLGVTKVYGDTDGELSITTDPRIGREKVIEAILNIVEDQAI